MVLRDSGATNLTHRNALIGSRLSDLKYSKGKSGYNYIHVILASNRKVINQKMFILGWGHSAKFNDRGLRAGWLAGSLSDYTANTGSILQAETCELPS